MHIVIAVLVIWFFSKPEPLVIGAVLNPEQTCESVTADIAAKAKADPSVRDFDVKCVEFDRGDRT